MTKSYTTQEPFWEMTENNWRGEASLNTQTLQWHAHIEPIDAPHFRTWAGQSFDSLEEARKWCQEVIARQSEPTSHSIMVPELPTPAVWSWLWERLHTELGKERLAALRAELVRWIQQNPSD